MEQVTVEVVQRKGEVILAQFPHGVIGSVEAKQTNEHGLGFGFYYPKEARLRLRKKHLLVAESNEQQYIGQNTGPRASRATTLLKYYVCIHDKKNGKLRILDNESGAQVFQMIPKSVITEEDEVKNDKNEELTFVEKKDQLIKAFGAAKRKRGMETRLRNKVKEDELQATVGASMTRALENVKPEHLLAAPIPIDGKESSIPPPNELSEKPQDVYKLGDIIAQHEFDMLRSEADVFLTASTKDLADWAQNSTYPRYVLDHVRTLAFAREATRVQQATCLLYLHYMITMSRMKAPQLQKREPFPSSIPRDICATLLRNFTLETVTKSRKVRCVPMRLKDKLISYILVLCLIIDDFQLEFTNLQVDLNITQARLQAYLLSLGCKVEKKKNEIGQIATLPIPFKRPEFVEKRKKGRR